MVDSGFMSFVGYFRFSSPDDVTGWLSASLEEYDVEDLGDIFQDVRDPIAASVAEILGAAKATGHAEPDDQGGLALIGQLPIDDPSGRLALQLAAAAIATTRFNGAEGELYLLGSAQDDFAVKLFGGGYSIDALGTTGEESFETVARGQTLAAVRATLAIGHDELAAYGFFVVDDE
jgi:hypothetical protein